MVSVDPFAPTADPTGDANQSLLPAGLPASFNPLRDLIPDFTPPRTPGFSFLNLLGPQTDNLPSYAPNLPNAAKAFVSKYQQIQPILDALPPEVAQAVYKFDAKRASKGQSPLGPDQTAKVVSSLVNNKPFTPDTEPRTDLPSIPGNAVNDLGQIVSALPRLPLDLLHTVQELPHLPSRINEAMQTPGGVGKQLQAVSQLPGFNLVPGAYTIGNLLAGQPRALIQHPLFVALDVMPLAKELAPGLTEALQETRLGHAAQATGEWLRTTRGGQGFAQMFGEDSRVAMRKLAKGEVRMLDAADPRRLDLLTPGSIDRFTNQIFDFSREWQKAIPPERQVALVELATTTSARDWSKLGLSDTELGYLNRYRDFITDMHSHIPDEHLLDGEVFYPNQIKRLNAIDRRIDVIQSRLDRTHLFTRFNALTNSAKFLNVAPETITSVMDTLRTDYLEPLLAKRAVPAAVKREAIRGYVSAYAAHGFDMDADVARATLRGSIKTARDFIETWKPVYTGAVNAPNSWPTRLVDGWLERNQGFTIARRDAQAEKLGERIAKLQDRRALVLPARFEPKVEQLRNQRVASRIGEVAIPEEQIPLAMDRLKNRQYRLLVNDGFLTNADFTRYTRDAMQTVAEMREQGFDPVFLHKVAPDRLSLLRSPRPFLRETTPSSLRERTYDVSPYVKDFTVSLPHQAMELLQQQVNREVLTSLFDTNPETRLFARTRTELEARYEPAARARASLNPRLDLHTWTDQMLNREWQRITPAHLPEDLREAAKGLLGEDVYIPKAVWKNLQRLMTPQSALRGLMDVPLKAFRISVLALSPRFLFNNLFGGMIENAAGTDFGGFKFFQEARDLVRSGELPESMKSTMGSTTRATEILPPIRDFQVRGGQTMGRLWNAIQDSKAAQLGQGVVKKSFDFAEFVDDTNRTMVYLYGKEKALAKEGMTVAEAEAAGEALARKTIQTLDDLTPLERSILRNVFPFYGYMRHVLKFAFHYAIDHPFRVGILAALSRMEQQDWSTGLPELFQGSFFVGKRSGTGDQKVLSLNGLNPWRDLANMFTLAGFASQVNPMVSGALRAVGVDTRSGGADLYPQLTYDAQTGTVAAKHQPLLGSIAQSLIPQQNVVAAIIGASSPLRDLMHTNPQAAQRMFASNLGFPLLFRTINVPEQQIKTELAREQVESSALHTALRTGDYSTAARHKNLRPLIAQVRALSASGDLNQYQVNQVNSPNMLVFAQQSLLAALTGTGTHP